MWRDFFYLCEVMIDEIKTTLYTSVLQFQSFLSRIAHSNVMFIAKLRWYKSIISALHGCSVCC